jgi:hypothetical protein
MFLFDILNTPSGCMQTCSERIAPTCTPLATGLRPLYKKPSLALRCCRSVVHRETCVLAGDRHPVTGHSHVKICTGRSRFTTLHFTTFHINDRFKILPYILVHTWKRFRNFGTYIQLHYILVSFYDVSFYDPVLLEPNPVVKRVLFWSRFTTFRFTTLFCWNLNPVVKRVLPVLVVWDTYSIVK